MIRISAEIDEKDTERIKQINAIKCFFLEKINKIDKSLDKLINRKRRKTTKIVVKGGFTSKNIEIQRFISEYFEILL
jgi:hypothetical protein